MEDAIYNIWQLQLNWSFMHSVYRDKLLLLLTELYNSCGCNTCSALSWCDAVSGSAMMPTFMERHFFYDRFLCTVLYVIINSLMQYWCIPLHFDIIISNVSLLPQLRTFSTQFSVHVPQWHLEILGKKTQITMWRTVALNLHINTNLMFKHMYLVTKRNQ